MSKRYDEAMELYQDGIKGILNNELQKAIIQFQKAQREFEAMSDHAMYCKSVNTMGVAYAGLGNDLMAVDCYLNGLNHAKTYGVVGLMSVFYNNIGTRYLELGEYKSAIKYCLMAEYDMIATGPDNKDNASWYILTYLNLAEGYYELEDYINSQIYIHQAQEISGRYDYHDADFSRGVLEARIEHALGRNEIVKELLPILIKQSERATINISDYWAVDDRRSIPISAMSATGVGESHHADTYEYAILGIEHDDLAEPINGHAKAAVTIGQVRCLTTTGATQTSGDAELGYMFCENG